MIEITAISLATMLVKVAVGGTIVSAFAWGIGRYHGEKGGIFSGRHGEDDIESEKAHR